MPCRGGGDHLVPPVTRGIFPTVAKSAAYSMKPHKNLQAITTKSGNQLNRITGSKRVYGRQTTRRPARELSNLSGKKRAKSVAAVVAQPSITQKLPQLFFVLSLGSEHI